MFFCCWIFFLQSRYCCFQNQPGACWHPAVFVAILGVTFSAFLLEMSLSRDLQVLNFNITYLSNSTGFSVIVWTSISAGACWHPSVLAVISSVTFSAFLLKMSLSFFLKVLNFNFTNLSNSTGFFVIVRTSISTGACWRPSVFAAILGVTFSAFLQKTSLSFFL